MIKVVKSPLLNGYGDTVQYRKPNSKKKRIVNKFKKNRLNWRFKPSILFDEKTMTIYCGEDVYEEILKESISQINSNYWQLNDKT